MDQNLLLGAAMETMEAPNKHSFTHCLPGRQGNRTHFGFGSGGRSTMLLQVAAGPAGGWSTAQAGAAHPSQFSLRSLDGYIYTIHRQMSPTKARVAVSLPPSQIAGPKPSRRQRFCSTLAMFFKNFFFVCLRQLRIADYYMLPCKNARLPKWRFLCGSGPSYWALENLYDHKCMHYNGVNKVPTPATCSSSNTALRWDPVGR